MKPVLLVGNGPMAEDYAKVLHHGLKRPFSIAGRNPEHLARFKENHGVDGYHLLRDLTARVVSGYEYAIVCTSRDSLQDVSEMLLELNVPALLIEKPVSASTTLSRKLEKAAAKAGTTVRVAMNRRYYKSVSELRRILGQDKPIGGHFDFTELQHLIALDQLPAPVLNRWAFGNSIHVFDTIRFLLGDFTQINATIVGQDELPWHPSGAHFFGSARCGHSPVSYSSSWSSPGRWDIQIMAPNGRYKLSPMERLQVLKPQTFQWVEVDCDYSMDQRFKPGLYEMLLSFEALLMSGVPCNLPDLTSNTRLLEAISEIVGYPA